MKERRRMIGFILTRILLVTLFLVATLLLRINAPVEVEEWLFSRFLLLMGAACLFSLASLGFLWLKERISASFATIQIIWDILFVTALLLVTGGIDSPFSFFYLLSVISASVLLSRRQALYAASLCGILYGTLIDFQYYGLLIPLGLKQSQASQYTLGYTFYTIFVNIAGFYLTALLTGYLSERALRSERALAEKAMDFDELTRLHSAIVTSVESGLMTLDPEERIRVFNAWAEQVTGVTQAQVYGRHLEEVLPEMQPVVTALRVRAELTLTRDGASPRIIGYKATTLTDQEGHSAGIIVNFQDVTERRRMEVELQRADRLAAVGELSARIAHEIRNPLAAISGSVQLIAQGQTISGEERQLLDIVVREAERLNALINDFLGYARPKNSHPEPTFLRQLLNDLINLTRSDRRFERITIRQEFADETAILVDADQFTQVLWNLFTNAADAMTGAGEGEIVVFVERIAEAEEGGSAKIWDKITVTDTGAGMTPRELAAIFQPFYTTKPGGTGLGLATVYRIIESHGGHIRVESTPGAGTSFHIQLPNKEVP